MKERIKEKKDINWFVKNMKVIDSGANYFVIEDSECFRLYSYNSLIAIRFKFGTPDTYLDNKTWNYSTTTGKHRNKFLNETKKETEAKIKVGEYLLDDLNWLISLSSPRERELRD